MAARGRGITLALGLVMVSGASSASGPHGKKLPKPPEVHAAPPPPSYAGPATVDAAEQAYAKLDYQTANAVAQALAGQHGLTHDSLVRAYRVLALTHAILDHSDLARDAFIALLAYSPDYQLDPNLGPKVEGPFFEARGFWRAEAARPGIELSPSVRYGEKGAVKVTTRDPGHMVKAVRAGTRWGSSGEYLVRTVAVGDAVSTDVPAGPPGATRLEYWASAVDDREDVVFEAGTPEAPRFLVVDVGANKPHATTPSGSLLSKPIFWLVTGAVVIGGAAAVFLATRPGTATSTTLSPTIRCGNPSDPATVCK